MRRIVAFVSFAIVMLLCIVSLNACDRGEITSDGLKFKLNEDKQGYTLVDIGTCDDEHVIIDTYRRKPITAIADGVFSGNDESGYAFCLVTRAGDLRQLGKDMTKALNGRGGGKPAFQQGRVQAKKAEIEAFFAQR